MRFPPCRSFSRVAALLFCAAITLSLSAAERHSSYRAAIESIKAEELGQQVSDLADPTLEGREAGTRGGHAAGDYLVEQYKKLNLKPAGVNGGYFQPFPPNFRNILASLVGSDPQLRDQVIVVGAHYDHVGYGGRGYSLGAYGYVHPGADDNASGTSTVLELAEAFTVLSEPPKRSILFAAWDAEEKGLFGSKYWVAHPTLPLDHVVAAINLDMVGRLRDSRLTIYGSRSGYGWRRLLSSHNDEPGLSLDFSWAMKPNADHYPFFERGIPVLMLHTGLHDDYHRPSDVAKLINRDGMSRVARLLFAALYEMADRPTAVPGFRSIARYETPDTEKAEISRTIKPTDRLGVTWVEDAAKTGGVVVFGVGAGSPAQQADVRPGDRITQFAGRDIRSDDDFFAAVAAAASPAAAKLVRRDEAKPLELKIELSGHALRWGIVWRIDDAEPGAVIVAHVVPGSPAALAGLKPNDRIYQADGKDFADEIAFAESARRAAASLSLLVERDGRLRVIMLTQPQNLRRAA